MDDVYNKFGGRNPLTKSKMVQDVEYISCIYHKILFSVSKEVTLNSAHYVITSVHNKIELKILPLIIQGILIITIL